MSEIKPNIGQVKTMPSVRVVAQTLWIMACVISGGVIQIVSNTPKG